MVLTDGPLRLSNTKFGVETHTDHAKRLTQVMKFWTNYVLSPKTNEHINSPRVKGTEFFYISTANVMFALPTDGVKMRQYGGKEKRAT
jgi:hypothetical protein